MRLDFAGPLFTHAERAWNARVAEALAGARHEVFLPQDAIRDLESLEAGPVFRLDVEGVRTADAVVAVLDGADPDSGRSFECGLAFGLGIPIVAVRTDFRAGGDDLPGQRIPAINLMLSEAATGVVLAADPGEEVARAILGALGRLGDPPAPPRRPSPGP